MELPAGRPDSSPSGEIPFVDQYCDRWCERCHLRPRCRVGKIHARLEANLAMGMPNHLAADDAYELDRELPEPAPEAVARWAEFEAEALTPDALAEAERDINRRDAFANTHPLVLDSREYLDLSRGVCQVLEPVVERLGQAELVAAVDVITRQNAVIAVKVWRAVWALADARMGESFEPHMYQDGVGTAKLVRLLIRESQEAWLTIAEAATVPSDGVPAAMTARLARLDDLLERQFPGAMNFIRPGFDEAPGQQ